MDYARQRIPRNSNNQPQALTVWIAAMLFTLKQ
jgi:hypothetical protein